VEPHRALRRALRILARESEGARCRGLGAIREYSDAPGPLGLAVFWYVTCPACRGSGQSREAMMDDKPKDQPADEHERPEEERPGPAPQPPPGPSPDAPLEERTPKDS